MADTKISALPASTTPLAGTEVLPIVQSSTTKQVSVANLTAGRAISATSVTASTGNFVVGTSGQGIDFSATPGTGTSELLADYEEGTWTPSVAPGGGAITYTSSGRYTKIGRVVIAEIRVDISLNSGGAGGLFISNFPFAASSAKSLCGATREDAAVGFGIVGSGYTTTSIYLTKDDGTYPGGTGYGFTLVVSYSV
jgi:hypothetical protein